MFRSRGENLRSVFILLFLYVAFFLLEHQDPQKFATLFGFDRDAVAAGEFWRVFTYQFTQAGQGWVEALSLFITLLLVYMMGAALEEEWGTFHFLTLFVVSTLTTAGAAAYLGTPILGTYFVYFTLLYVYAAAFPQQTFYLFGMIPFRVRVLAAFSLAVLLYGVFTRGGANLAAFAGAAAGYVYYLGQRVRVVPAATKETEAEAPPPQVRIDTTAIHNGARFAAIKKALANESHTDIDRLLGHCEREIVKGVNICPPVDYKPENADGYCIRCEGFAECSARYLKLERPAAPPPPLAVPNADAS